MIKLIPNIIGYHANDKKRCERFLQDNCYMIASEDTHWLGDGMYFWDNLSNAKYWAKEKRRKQETQTIWIVESHIILDNVLDLTDSELRQKIWELWVLYDRQLKRAGKFNSQKYKYLGQRLNALFKVFPSLSSYDVIKAHAHYPKTPSDKLLDEVYKFLPEDIPYVDDSIKTIYCVKRNKKIMNRKKKQ